MDIAVQALLYLATIHKSSKKNNFNRNAHLNLIHFSDPDNSHRALSRHPLIPGTLEMDSNLQMLIVWICLFN